MKKHEKKRKKIDINTTNKPANRKGLRKKLITIINLVIKKRTM